MIGKTDATASEPVDRPVTIEDLGATVYQALGINVWRQVVGVSCNAGGCRGVLWKGGQVIDIEGADLPTADEVRQAVLAARGEPV